MIQRIVLCVVLFLLGIYAIAFVFGIRINTTDSIPVGIYRSIDAPLKKGDFVLFCPPDTAIFQMAKKRAYIAGGLCTGGLGKLFKRIVAIPGDRVQMLPDAIFVDGNPIPNSARLEVDGKNRVLPTPNSTKFQLKPDEYFLMGDNVTSFDSRYFGPINRKQIQSVVQPVWIRLSLRN